MSRLRSGNDAEPMDFDEPRRGDERQHRRHRRVVALRLTDREDGARGARGRHELVRLGQRPGHGLLHQRGDATLEEPKRNVPVKLGGHGNRDGIDGSEDVVEIRQRRRTRRRRRRGGTLGVRVDDSNELDALERAQNSRVVATEMPDADDGRAQLISRQAARSSAARRSQCQLRLPT